MKKKEIKYIERKTQDGRFLNHAGPAILGEVVFSKSGKTIYYDGMAFTKPSSNEQRCIYGNYYQYDPTEKEDIHPDEYWISGIKKRGSNRYPGFERHPVVESGNLI